MRTAGDDEIDGFEQDDLYMGRWMTRVRNRSGYIKNRVMNERITEDEQTMDWRDE
jgi:hypothetical protein